MFEPSPSRAVRGALLLLLLLAVGVIAPTPSQAGQYHAYLCSSPLTGRTESIPGLIGGWNTAYIVASDTCKTQRAAVLGLGSATRTPGELAQFTLPAPANTSFAAVDLKRRVLVRGGSDLSATPEYIFYKDADLYDGAHVIENCAYAFGCASIDWPSGSTVSATLDHSPKLIWQVHCGGGGNGAYCGGTGDGTQRIQFEILGLHLVVNDESAPSSGGVSAVAGGSVNPTSVTGSASDLGGGVYQFSVTLDQPAGGAERVVGRSTVGGECSDRGNDPSSDLDFEQLVPCPANATLTVPLDTSSVSTGAHLMRTYARDAGGNTTLIDSRNVTISRPSPTPAKTPAAAPGSTPAPSTATAVPADVGQPGPATDPCPEARIVLAGKARTATVTSGGKLTISGTLVGGSCAAGVQVSELASSPGAAWSSPVTIHPAADGKFSYALASTASSRTIRFTYDYGTLGARSLETFRVLVRAGMTISGPSQPLARRAPIALAGKVDLAKLPSSGLYVQIQVRSGNRWQTIDEARVRTGGIWSWSYRLVRAKFASYRFRAHLRSSAELPGIEPSSSPTATVRIRR